MTLEGNVTEYELEIITEHLTQIYNAYLDMCVNGKWNVGPFIEELRGAHPLVPVQEHYQRLIEKKLINLVQYQDLLSDRKTYLAKLITS